ncbi:MAG TPA: hypothetical protein VK395_19235, partial [Gemmataceae bacterium]|nr:hypothetical protein [Gemmataceae bacterium]
ATPATGGKVVGETSAGEGTAGCPSGPGGGQAAREQHGVGMEKDATAAATSTSTSKGIGIYTTPSFL